MTNRIQSLRSSVAGARPAGQIPGTIYTNFADRQIGVVNPANAALDLVAVRFHSTTASYVQGDYVVIGGQMYRAPGPIGPGAFNAGQWVAIGNAMFDQSLNTVDNVRFRSLLLGMTGVPGALNFVRDDNAFVARVFELAGGVGLGIEQGGGQPILFYTAGGAPNGANERMRIDPTGNVGIGTTPAAAIRLDVRHDNVGFGGVQASNASATGYAGFRLDNSAFQSLLYMAGSAYPANAVDAPSRTVLYTNGPGITLSGQDVRVATAGAERMRVDAAGNVGIGRPSTGAILDVYRNFAGSTHSFVTNDNTGVNCVAQTIVGNGSNGTAVAHFGVGFVPTGGLWQADAGSLHSSGVNGLVVWTQGTAPLRFGTNAVERMRIDPAGNVGIGTTNPLRQLHVVANANASTALIIENTNQQPLAETRWQLTTGASVTAGIKFPPTDPSYPDSFVLFDNCAGGMYFRQATAAPIRFLTNEAERMRIDAAGNVGIGTTNPASYYSDQTLVVAGATNGAIMIAGPASGSPGLYFAHTENPALQKGWVLYGNATDTMRFGTNNTERMRLGSDGTVTIQNSVDDHYFLFAGSSKAVRMTTSGATAFIHGTDPTGNGSYQPLTIAGSFLSLGTPAGEAVKIDANGYFKASNFGTYLFPTLLKHEFVSNKDGEECLSVTNSFGGNPYGLVVNFSGGAPNNATNYFYKAQDTLGIRMILLANGGLQNYSGNDTNLSDEGVKADITPYDDKELDGLEKSFTSVIWGKYKYRDQTHDDWNHGPTAQGVERAFALTAPELVDEGAIGLKSEAGDVKHKVVYETDLTHIAHALLARGLTEIKELKATILELKAAIALLTGGKPASA